ncbi:MAG: sugar transferase [Pirellulales bacterium]|nr:sugar transferase [Pirellulales bacterium]
MRQASASQSAAASAARLSRHWGAKLPGRGTASPDEVWAIGRAGRVLKRSLDITVALIGLALGGLAVLLMALPLKACGGRLDLKRETRVGLGGKRFQAYRLRAGKGRWIGWWQHFGLDRVLWLINVLRGEMSLVGPWPMRVELLDLPDVVAFERYRVPPGLCSWAQVNGIRRDAPAAISLEYDLYYIRNWSFLLDLFILAVAPFRLFVGKHGC